MIVFLCYFIILFLSYTTYSYYSSGNRGIDKVESESTLYEEDITGVWKCSIGDIVYNPNSSKMERFKITGYVYYNGKSYYALNDIDQWNNYCDVPKFELEDKWKLLYTN